MNKRGWTPSDRPEFSVDLTHRLEGKIVDVGPWPI